jgi:hypothetical protein
MRRLLTGAVLAAAIAVGACADGPRHAGAPVGIAFGETHDPTVAADARSGAHYAAWIETRDGMADVWLSRSGDGAAWSGPIRVNDVRGDAAPHEQAPAQVAVAPDGSVYVVWQSTTPLEGRRFPASDLRFARSTDGGRSFAPAIAVNRRAIVPAGHTFQDLHVAGDGTVFVSWIDTSERARAEVGAGAEASHAHGAHGAELPPNEIRVARSVDGGLSFEDAVTVERGVCPCCRTAMTSGGGVLYVAWRTATDDIRDIALARSEDGGRSFSAPARVHPDGWRIAGCPHAGPALAVDGAGRLHAAWYTGRDGGPGLYRAVSSDGGRSFSAPLPVLTDAWVPPSLAKLATDAQGTVWLAWEDRRTEDARVHVARLDGTRAVYGRGDAGGRAPSLAGAADGATLVWQGADGVNARTVSRMNR